MSEDEEQAIVSLQDVIEEDQQLEDTANAVLGDSDDTQCTYRRVGRFIYSYYTAIINAPINVSPHTPRVRVGGDLTHAIV